MYVKRIQGHTHCPQKCVGVNPFCEYKLTELSRRTYYFDLTSEEWSLGPDFPHGAYGHTNPPECVQLGNGLVVVHYSPFSQVYVLIDEEWKSAPPVLPKQSHGKLVAYGQDSVLLTGGYVKNHIRELSCSNNGTCGEWNEIGTFPVGKYRHVAIMIPDDHVPCNYS